METACQELKSSAGIERGRALVAHPDHANPDKHTGGVNASLPDALFNDRDAKFTYKTEKPWHRGAISMAQNGYTYTEIAEAFGVTSQAVSEVLRQPWARQRLINEIKQNAKDELHSMIEKAASQSFLRIVKLAEDEKVPPTVRLSANQEILNRFLGKPTQPISTAADDLTNLSDKELERIATSGRGSPPPSPNPPKPD